MEHPLTAPGGRTRFPRRDVIVYGLSRLATLLRSPEVQKVRVLQHSRPRRVWGGNVCGGRFLEPASRLLVAAGLAEFHGAPGVAVGLQGVEGTIARLESGLPSIAQSVVGPDAGIGLVSCHDSHILQSFGIIKEHRVVSSCRMCGADSIGM